LSFFFSSFAVEDREEEAQQVGICFKTKSSHEIMSSKSKFPGFFGESSSKDGKPVEPHSISRKERADSSDHDLSDDESTTVECKIRQNFGKEIVGRLNKQINLELQACYTYRSMAVYFEKSNVALPGFSRYFDINADEEKKHARAMMRYINKRGGSVVLDDIVKPPSVNWGTGLGAMTSALDMEKSLNEALLDLHKLTIKNQDPHSEEFVKKYLDEQVVTIKKLGSHVTQLKRVGPGLGEYMFGQKTLRAEILVSDSDSSSSSSDSECEDKKIITVRRRRCRGRRH
jgi:ferritin heavy chain